MEKLPGYKPMGEAGLNTLMKLWGADTPEKREACLKGFNALTEQNIARRGLRIIGVSDQSVLFDVVSDMSLQVKPEVGQQGVFHVRIPDSPLAIRMWEGGMGPYGQFCFDFYDIERDVSVNLPQGYSLHPATVNTPPGLGPGYLPPGFPMALNAPGSLSGLLRSWERNMGMREIPEGEEKWMVPQGAYITLQRDGHEPVIFQIPGQPAFVALPTYAGPPRVRPL